MTIKVRISNALTSRLVEYEIELHDKSTFEDVDAYHAGLAKMHPNAHVNFTWYTKGCDKASFICGMPVNMRIDGETLPFDEYYAKWHSPTSFAAEASQVSNTLVDTFLNSEFSN